MSILNKKTLDAFSKQGDELKKRVKFWREDTKLVAEYEGKQFKIETALSLAKANEAYEASEGTPHDVFKVVCENAEELDSLPSAVFLHIFNAYDEAIAKVQGVELGE